MLCGCGVGRDGGAGLNGVVLCFWVGYVRGFGVREVVL